MAEKIAGVSLREERRGPKPAFKTFPQDGPIQRRSDQWLWLRWLPMAAYSLGLPLSSDACEILLILLCLTAVIMFQPGQRDYI